MSEITIRAARPEDWERVAALLAELGRPTPTRATAGALREGYLRYLERDDTAPLVAEREGEVIGFMSLEFRQRLNRTLPQAWIPDLIVTERARGGGAGRALLLRGFDLARERGCWDVTLESGHARAAAHRLYRSAGMADLGLFFSRNPAADRE